MRESPGRSSRTAGSISHKVWRSEAEAVRRGSSNRGIELTRQELHGDEGDGNRSDRRRMNLIVHPVAQTPKCCETPASELSSGPAPSGAPKAGYIDRSPNLTPKTSARLHRRGSPYHALAADCAETVPFTRAHAPKAFASPAPDGASSRTLRNEGEQLSELKATANVSVR